MTGRNSAVAPCLFVAFILLVWIPAAGGAAAKVSLPPKPQRYVTDLSGTLPADRAESLNAKLEQFERETSNQVLVWIDRRIPEGWDINGFATAALRAWGVGQKGKNNGVLIVIFVDDHKMWIEVGYGLEGILPDAIANRISEDMRSRFRQGDYVGGLEAGIDGVIAATRGEYRGSGTTVDESKRRRGKSIGGCSPFFFLLFFIFLPLLRLSRWRTYGSRGWRTGGGGWAALGGFLGGGGGGFLGGGGGGFSGGGFSGGGGSSGGGGAGGSW